MATTSAADRRDLIGPNSEPRRRWWQVRLSLRTVLYLVVVVGVGLGWLVHRATVQRDAVAAIRAAGGKAFYDWELTTEVTSYGHAPRLNPQATPHWPEWLVDQLGPDYFGTIQQVILGSSSTDTTLAQVGRLGRLEDLDAPTGGRFTDAGLGHLRTLKHLRSFGLNGRTGVTGAGLAQLAGLTALERLAFGTSPVGDADLAWVRLLVNLRMLRFSQGSGITDAGMTQLRDLRQLRELIISHSKITGQGLASLTSMSQLNDLMVLGSRIETLAALRPMANLKLLFVVKAPLNDAGLEVVKHLPSLAQLRLDKTQITDEGLRSLVGVSSLRGVSVNGTLVTDQGAASFRQAQPNVDLVH